jgi:two-component system osmolarity sensor histidine kinase EnvZ
MRLFDTMFARTAWLILAVVLALFALLLFVQRSVTVFPAMRTSAAAIAELLQHDPAALAEARLPGPPETTWRDRVLAASPVWRTFSSELRERLGPQAQLEIRGQEAGPVIWVRLPRAPGWIARQMDLPSNDLRGVFLVVVLGVVVAIFGSAALLARQLTDPLRRLAKMADRFAAGVPPGETAVGGPAEIRQVQQAFTRLSHSLRSAEQEREALLAGVSHDLRTPIGRMRLAVGLYGEGADPKLVEELEHDLDELEQAAGQFIVYARSSHEEATSLEVLDDLVDAVVTAWACLPHGDALEIDWKGGAVRPIQLEARNVKRVVENLLDNAARHGRAPIVVRTEQSERQVALIVRDAGLGIAAADHVTALQPFVRLTGAESSGSGLGLAIVDRIARRHGGAVSMTASENGFEVRVTFASASTPLAG